MKFKLDRHSIKFKTWMYFVLFTLMLIIVLWVLQVIFLNNFYDTMKTQQTNRVIRSINESYNANSKGKFIKELSTIADTNDLYIYLVDSDGEIKSFQPSGEVYKEGLYLDQIEEVDEELEESESSSGFVQLRRIDSSRQVLAYGGILKVDSVKNTAPSTQANESDEPLFERDPFERDVLNNESSEYDSEVTETQSSNESDTSYSRDKETYRIYLFAPLWPVRSTIKILTSQLAYVTLISLILAFFISLYLSRRISNPILEISRSARRLGSGEYGIVFKGGHYTEIDNLADTLTNASIELEKSDAMQKDLVANVSHDLRTPLTMIKSYAEMIRDLSGDDPAKREKHLQVIIDETDRLNTLVEDLLSVSKMQSGRMTLNMSEFNLSDTLRSIVNTYEIRQEDGYNVNLDCPAEFYVTADEEKIKQVITNLVTNAIKFSGEDKTVNVSLSQERSQVVCKVEDHGIGIARDELEHVWDRYYKASSNMVRAIEGTGLGLSIVKEIMILHKSEYGVDSVLGEGTTFWFKLSLTKVDETAMYPEFTLSDGSQYDRDEDDVNVNDSIPSGGIDSIDSKEN